MITITYEKIVNQFLCLIINFLKKYREIQGKKTKKILKPALRKSGQGRLVVKLLYLFFLRSLIINRYFSNSAAAEAP